MEKELRRGLAASLLVAGLGFSAFLRTHGSEAVHAVQIVSLLTSGMGLGVALALARIMWGLRSRR